MAMIQPELPPPRTSPKWGSNIKLIVGLTFVAIAAALVIYVRSIVGPLLLVVILTYLLHPVADRLSRLTRLSWRGSVNLIYLILVVLLVTSITLSGLAAVQQIQNLITVIDGFLKNLPNLIDTLSNQVYHFGPFDFSLRQYDVASITQQLLSSVQTLIGRLGSLVSTVATSAASIIGWGVFVLLVSYFILAETKQVSTDILFVEIPGYDYDIRRLISELRKIWNAFLRGQLILFGLIALSYTVLMTILGVRYSLAIALLAGLARFVPYLGPLITWTVLVLVAFFQGGNYFGLSPLQFTILALGTAIIIDQIFDNIVAPRVFSHTLRVHPAAVLIAAIIAANLIGVIGLVLAAPTLATIKLFLKYFGRKMLDLDPWPTIEEDIGPPKTIGESEAVRRLRQWYRARQSESK